jgi:hypothetical protein
VPGEDVVRYNRRSKLYAISPGDYGRVLNANHRDNTITVRLEDGREITYNPERLSGVSVYKEAERQFAEKDRIQFRAPFAEAKVKNSELGTITEIVDGRLTVVLAGKRIVTFDPERFPHLDHGYAVTSYSAQGKTMDRVLVNAETTETDLLLNQRMAYVAVSRARFDAHVYTDSAADLGGALNRQKNKEMALEALKESQTVMGNEASIELPTIARHKEVPGFESLTQAGPRELSQAEKDPFSIARLRGRAIVAQSNVAVAQKQAEVFEKSKHFISLEIDGDRWSLVSIDREQRCKERAIALNQRAVSAYRKRLYSVIHNPIKLFGIGDYKEKAIRAKGRIKQLREDISQLQPIRESVTEFIAESREVLRGHVEQETQSSSTLNNALAVEVDLHLKSGQGIPQPEFSEQELARLEENATKIRDFKMLKTVQNYLERHYGETQKGIEKITACISRVEDSAKASLRGTSERIRSFIENRESFPVSFKGSDGSEKTASLNELAPTTFGERVAGYFSIGQRLESAAVQQALDQHHEDLLQERDLVQQFVQQVGELAEIYHESFRTMNRVTPLTQFMSEYGAVFENFAAQEASSGFSMQNDALNVSATRENALNGISNRAQQAPKGTDLGMAHQQLTAEDHLEQSRQTLDRVTIIAANEAGMGAEVAADTEAASSEALAALL